MNSQCCLNKCHAPGRSPLNQSIFGVLALIFPSIISHSFSFLSLVLACIDLADQWPFGEAIISDHSDTMFCITQHTSPCLSKCLFSYPKCIAYITHVPVSLFLGVCGQLHTYVYIMYKVLN